MRDIPAKEGSTCEVRGLALNTAEVSALAGLAWCGDSVEPVTYAARLHLLY